MSNLTIELPADVLLATGQSPEEFLREAKLLLALKLFEVGRLSSGKAAQLASLGRAEFLRAASESGVPVTDLDDEELEREFLDG